jgi:hypothetical protein
VFWLYLRVLREAVHPQKLAEQHAYAIHTSASPAVALIMSGRPTSLDTLTASFSSAIRPSEPGTVGTPAFCMATAAAEQQQENRSEL